MSTAPRQTGQPETKSQHYVPRVYLRRFSTNGKRLWAYDKLTGKSYSTSVDNVAQQNRFYDLPVGGTGVSPGWEKQYVEKWLGQGEASYGRDLDAVVASAEANSAIPIELKRRLSLPIATQLVRTPQFRDQLIASYAMRRRQTYDEANEKGLSVEEAERLCEERGIGLAVGQQDGVVRHAHLMLEPTELERHCDLLMQCAWIIGRNETHVPFYTSDDPVVDCARGFVVMFLPISSDRVLLMYSPNSYPPYMAPFTDLDGVCFDLDEEDVQHFNRMQASQSQRHVFCAVDEFALARAVVDGTIAPWTPEEEQLDIPFVKIAPEYIELGRLLAEGAQEVQSKYGG